MGKRIPLHPKFGLNSTLSVCFYCGEETGEIALLGNKYKGEAPMHMCTSLKPCDKCKEKFKDYTLIVEVLDYQDPDHHPTGRWIAAPKDCLNPEVAKSPVALCLQSEFTQIVNRFDKEDK